MSVGAQASIVVAGVGAGGVLRGLSDISKWAKLDTFDTSRFRIDSNTRRFFGFWFVMPQHS